MRRPDGIIDGCFRLGNGRETSVRKDAYNHGRCELGHAAELFHTARDMRLIPLDIFVCRMLNYHVDTRWYFFRVRLVMW